MVEKQDTIPKIGYLVVEILVCRFENKVPWTIIWYCSCRPAFNLNCLWLVGVLVHKREIDGSFRGSSIRPVTESGEN